MGDKLLKEIEKGSKLAVMKKRIITHYIYNGSSTITDLAKEMDLSVLLSQSSLMKCVRMGTLMTMESWKPVEADILVCMD